MGRRLADRAGAIIIHGSLRPTYFPLPGAAPPATIRVRRSPRPTAFWLFALALAALYACADTSTSPTGIDPAAKWVMFEGADGAAHVRSLPLKKVLDDCLIVYAQNGEMLRPEQGYPVRLFVPGWEGNVCVKWLRRIKVGDQPWHFRSETARYTDPMPDGMWRQFSFEMECKSVITRPSGGMTIRPGMTIMAQMILLRCVFTHSRLPNR